MQRSAHPVSPHPLVLAVTMPVLPDTGGAKPRKRRKALDPEQLSSMLLKRGYSLSRSAFALDVSIITARVDAVRLGIPVDSRPSKITADVTGGVLGALRTGTPLAQISSAHGISLASLYRIMRMHPDAARQHRQQSLAHEKAQRRHRWLTGEPELPLSRRRDYCWLRRHDPVWLASQLQRRNDRPGEHAPGRVLTADLSIDL